MSVNVRHWVSQHFMPWAICLPVVGGGLALTILKMYWSSTSQAEHQLQVIEIVQQPNLPGAVFVNQQPIQVGTSLTRGQQLTTQAGAKVALQQTDAEGARLGSGSSLTLEKDCLQLGNGSVVITGLSGCLGAIIVNGTKGIYTLERVNYSAEIKVLAGQVEVSVPRNPIAQSIPLQQDQKITIGLTGDEVGPVRLMLPSETQRIANGNLFQGFQIPLPKQAEIAELRTPTIAPTPAPSISSKPPAILPAPTPSASVQPTTIAPSPTPSASVKPTAIAPAAPSPATVDPSQQPAPPLRPKHTPGCS